MQDQFETFVWGVAVSIFAGALIYILRIALARYLRPRLPAGLVPSGEELNRPDATSRLLSLVGHGAAPAETLGEKRLRATIGLRLLYWGVFLATAAMLHAMDGAPLGFEGAILLLLIYLAVHASLYEIRYDRDTVSLPRWWFGRTTRRWRDLDVVFERRGWFLMFHFRDGAVVQVHKYVVGYAALRDKARAAEREV